MSKIALVTGGTGGIGSAICKQLVADGFRVIATYLNHNDKLKTWSYNMYAKGFAISLYQCDVADFSSCANLINQISNEQGSIDVLVNNAGITKDATLKKLSYQNWLDVINTNLNSVYNMSKHVIDNMINNSWGRIINISSINGQKGQFGQTNYSAAKAGIHGFTMALAQEVAKKGITVNTIAPGYIATDMVMAIDEAIRDKIIESIPIGRLGTPQEIASLVGFLASDNAGFITGSEIAINGGQHMM
jgi:acetoacetyl-CoA reductase